MSLIASQTYVLQHIYHYRIMLTEGDFLIFSVELRKTSELYIIARTGCILNSCGSRAEQTELKM